MNGLIDRILQGDIRAAARLIRDIDDQAPSALKNMKELFPHTGRAYIIGVTGSPGVGKSTLTDRLALYIRAMGKTVGILAVDPSSPFTGGAILGDRIRMQRHNTDEGVFIRSLAARGHLGGLAQAAHGAIMVLDAMGKDYIIVETVGVGQDEVDVARAAHTTIIVMVPGFGDDIQSMKAGILEVGDIFVVNKADRGGADKTVQDLLGMIALRRAVGRDQDEWRQPIVKTAAVRGEGLDEFWNAVQSHRSFLSGGQSDQYKKLTRLNHKLLLTDLVKQRIVDSVLKKLEESGELDRCVDDLSARRSDPYTLSEQILDKLYKT